jgi:shikimate 5-dehydrogenase
VIYLPRRLLTRYVQLAYKPLETLLIKQMRKFANRGWITVDGLQVLPEQGLAQFELFTGRRAPANQMRTALMNKYKEL